MKEVIDLICEEVASSNFILYYLFSIPILNTTYVLTNLILILLLLLF